MSLREVGLKEYSSLVDTAFRPLWYEEGRGRSPHWRVEKWGREAQEKQNKNNPGTEGECTLLSLSMEKGVSFGEPVCPAALGSTAHYCQKEMVARCSLHVKSSSPQHHTSSNISNILKNPHIAPARPM